MRDVGIQTIETKRLILRKLEMADVPFYYQRLGSSADVAEFMLWNPHRDISESIASIQKAIARYQAGGCYRWAIALREDNSLIGVIELLKFDEAENTCSFAYMLGKDFWGRGYGTEALNAALEFAFTQLELDAVESDHFAENGASGAVMRKVGMAYQGTAVRKYEKNGISYDAPMYRVTAAEWRRINSK